MARLRRLAARSLRMKVARLRRSTLQVWGLVWSLASPYTQRRLVGAVLLVTAASALAALGPVALKFLVDGFAARDARFAASSAVLIALAVLAQWLARLLGEIRGLVYAQAERRMMREIGANVFAHVIQLPLRAFLKWPTGAISQTLQNGLQGYHLVVSTLVFSILPVAVELGTIVVILSRLGEPSLLGIFCVAALGYAVAFGISAVNIMSHARAASQSQVDANAIITDSIQSYEAVKHFTAESLIAGRVGTYLRETELGWVGFSRRFAYYGMVVGTIYAAFLLATYWYGAREVQSGRMTVGTFVLISTYVAQLVRPLEMLGIAMQYLMQGVAFLGRMFDLLEENTEAASPDAEPPLSGPGRLRFAQVGLSYRRGHAVLRNVDFEVEPGRTLGIVGASGAGKSTIVRLLTRLVEPDQGHILLDGVPIEEISLGRLRRAIAVVPQDAVLLSDTIGYNIGLGKPGCTAQEIEQAARLANLHDLVMSLPDRYETQIGERGIRLSGGERQRLAIARAALKRPLIFVCDEATSSLDSRTEREIARNLREIAHCCTTIVIAHRLSTVVHADEIVVLDSGAIVERGTHEALLRRRGYYAALWQAQRRHRAKRESIRPSEAAFTGNAPRQASSDLRA